MGALGVVGLVVLMLRWRGVNFDTCLRLSVLRHIDEGALKILWSTMQIVSSVQWNLSKWDKIAGIIIEEIDTPHILNLFGNTSFENNPHQAWNFRHPSVISSQFLASYNLTSSPSIVLVERTLFTIKST